MDFNLFSVLFAAVVVVVLNYQNPLQTVQRTVLETQVSSSDLTWGKEL